MRVRDLIAVAPWWASLRGQNPLKALLVVMALALAAPATAQTSAAPALRDTNTIVAIVNGEVVTRADVTGRARLFAIGAGMAVAPEVLERLVPQVIRLLIDERLRLQEVQRRRIPVGDADIAEAVTDIERRNGLPPGALLGQLRQVGVPPRVLFDQLRTQIGWARLIRAMLGTQATPTEAEIADAITAAKARVGQPEYLVSEVFIPLDDPRAEAEAIAFVNQVIAQLRAGTPFPVVATQFSQAQSAVQGGDLGWVRPEAVDPEVAEVIERMPPGAISNPIRVAGGYQVVTLRQRREQGRDLATMLSIRQAFFPFVGAIDPASPTAQQREAFERAQRLSQTARSCDVVEQAGRGAGPDRPTDPGPIRLESVGSGPLRALLAGLPPGRASQPVITAEGALVVMVCTRESRNLAELSPDQARAQLVRDRIENAARQLQRDLRRRAAIEMRG